MKAYTHVTDEHGNSYEEELGEVAIFVSNLEEVQELIDFLTYVKEDHLIQHRDNGIEMTHSHFNMWKGKETGALDLQIWSSAQD